MKTIIKLGLSASALLWAASNALAGVVFEVETTYHAESPTVETSQMSVEKPNMKMEISAGKSQSDSGQNQDAIFKGESREMVVINHEEQYYMVMDAATMNQIGGQVSGQMDQAMNELEKHMAGMDPKQRAMMEGLLKGKMGDMIPQHAAPKPVKTELVKTAEKATHQGYPCVKYEVRRGDEKIRELWVTDWNNIKGSAEVAETFRDMADFGQEMMQATSKMVGHKAMGFLDIDQSGFDAFAKVEGFPVLTRAFKKGQLQSETILKSVTEREFDPDTFEPPEGYKRRTMGM